LIGGGRKSAKQGNNPVGNATRPLRVTREVPARAVD
jgi:hypothetical protein